MDKDRKETILEAQEQINDLIILNDLLREELTDLQQENKALKGYLQRKETDVTFPNYVLEVV